MKLMLLLTHCTGETWLLVQQLVFYAVTFFFFHGYGSSLLMGFLDVAFLPSRAGFYTAFLLNCGRC